MTMDSMHPSRIGMATFAVGVGTGKLVQDLIPFLAAVSYVVGIAAGLVTIYFAIRNKKND